MSGGSALPGTPCDDGNASTGNDVYQSDCSCEGQVIDCTGVVGEWPYPAPACDDGNNNTINDTGAAAASASAPRPTSIAKA
ncbi:MAG: hypothetical protein R2818_09970 [Flavobacteriales bacterium]